MSKYKIFVPWGSEGYASWMHNTTICNSIEEADILLLTGGEDISPRLYNHRQHHTTHTTSARCETEVRAYKEAINKGIPIIGICRGHQMIGAMNGATLIQDMSHSHNHNCITHDFKEFILNSLHHQMIDHRSLKGDYVITMYCDKMSPYYFGEGDKNLYKDMKIDIEGIFFPHTKSWGVQFHPEMLNSNDPVLNYLRLDIYERLGLNLSKIAIEDLYELVHGKKQINYLSRPPVDIQVKEMQLNALEHKSFNEVSPHYYIEQKPRRNAPSSAGNKSINHSLSNFDNYFNIVDTPEIDTTEHSVTISDIDKI